MTTRVEIDRRLIWDTPDHPDCEVCKDPTAVILMRHYDDEPTARAALSALAERWDTDLVDAEGYVDSDGGTYENTRGGQMVLFNGPVRGEEIQGHAWIYVEGQNLVDDYVSATVDARRAGLSDG